jgi:16S rRNA (cytosine1402-N4)-methyltransferase
MSPMTYHSPVLLKESIEGLNLKPDGVYVDVTFGGGGHSKEILKFLKNGRLYSFDQDHDATANNIESSNFKLIKANFRFLKNFLKLEGIEKIDGVIADLGVSSHQFDTAARGFSLRFDSELDMRMNIDSNLNAKEIINNYSEEQLANMFYIYGDITQSRKLAKQIVNARKEQNILTTTELILIAENLSPVKKRNQFLARVFQAIRIEVNDEINALKDMLNSATKLLNPGGRIVVISYHSLEDKIVKNLFKKGNTDGVVEKDFFGNISKVFNQINKNVIVPSSDECTFNNRATSAKMRVAEKIAYVKK